MTAWPTALKSFTPLTDGFTLEQATNVNALYDEVAAMQLQGSQNALFASWVNSQTLSAGKTLVDADYLFQSLDPNGSDRDVTLPALGSGNHAFFITNKGSANTLTVKNPAAATLATLAAGDSLLFFSDGIAWRCEKSALKTYFDTLYGASTTLTLTNKRITPRVSTEASNATPTPAADSVDMHTITAQAEAAAFAAPTGTPTAGQKLIIRIKDNGTARALSWNAIYRAMGTALPSTTVLSKTLYLGFIYNSTDSKWDLVASAQEV